MGPEWNNFAPIAREGLKYIAIAFLACVLTFFFFDILWLELTFLGILLFLIFFFRNPERLVPLDNMAIISPADGRVLIAEPLPVDSGSTPKFKIAIFLSVLNVHVNRAPITAMVRRITYRPGKFSMAFRTKESEDNEQNELILQDDQGRRVTVVQIAGFLARRIVCYLKKGSYVHAGDRLGIIQFGSRVNLIIEGDIDVHVQPGDHVVAGETILAHFRYPESPP